MMLLWRVVFALTILIAYVGYAHPDWIVDPALPKASAAMPSQTVTHSDIFSGK